MAISQNETVVLSSTNADTVDGPVRVEGIKVVGGAGGMTVKLRADQSASGTILYECTVGASAEKFEQVEFKARGGLYINITAGSGTIYIYRE